MNSQYSFLKVNQRTRQTNLPGPQFYFFLYKWLRIKDRTGFFLCAVLILFHSACYEFN